MNKYYYTIRSWWDKLYMLVVQCVFFQTLHIHSLTKHLQVSLQKEMPIFKSKIILYYFVIWLFGIGILRKDAS